MPPVLRALPYSDSRTTALVRGAPVEVLAHQIIVWVGVAQPQERRPSPNSPRFPAILDTGFSGTFAISPVQLERWADLKWNALPFDPTFRMKYFGVEVPHRRANLWVYPNQYGWRDEIDPIIPPRHLDLIGGIAVYGDGEQVGSAATARLVAPRLPLLGLRALAHNRLQLTIDAADREVWLSS
jgi:hypothetical protein